MDPRPSCNVCQRRIGLKTCSRCKQAFYCSVQHQQSDWKRHKDLCRPHIPEKADVVHPRADHVAEEAPPSFISFDRRPLKICQAEDGSSFRGNYSDLSAKVVSQLHKAGYAVVDQALASNLLEGVLVEYGNLRDQGLMKPGKLQGGHTSSEESSKIIRTDIRSDEICWLEGTEDGYPKICEAVRTMDTIIAHIDQRLPNNSICSRTKAMAAHYSGEGSYYRRHVDNPNGDGRLLTCILYLNKDWEPEVDGGLLRIFEDTSDDSDYVDLIPQFNRLLIFWSDTRNPHEVQPSNKTRYALTTWYFDKEERSRAKGEVIDKGEKTTMVPMTSRTIEELSSEMEALEVKVQSQSKQAVSELSQQELQGLWALVKGEADPQQLLSQMGIAPAIQQELLKTLSQFDVDEGDSF